MKKSIIGFLYFLSSLLFCQVCFANNINLQQLSLYKGRVLVNIPETFQLIKDNDAVAKNSARLTKKKFAYWNRPRLVFVDSNHNNVIIDYEQKPLKDSELSGDLKDFAKGFTQAFPFATIYDKKIVTVNGKEFAVLKIKTNASTRGVTHSMIIYTALENRKLSFTLFLNEQDYPDWDKLMQKMVASLRINE